jgi:hypothetical protein
MVENIFAEQALNACFIEGDQSRDHRIRWSGLGPRHGRLPGNVASSGLKRNVLQPMLLDAALIAEAQINSFCAAQIRGQRFYSLQIDRCSKWAAAPAACIGFVQERMVNGNATQPVGFRDHD